MIKLTYDEGIKGDSSIFKINDVLKGADPFNASSNNNRDCPFYFTYHLSMTLLLHPD